MTAGHVVWLVLLAAGVAALLLGAAAAVALPGVLARLHALTVASSVGVPLVCVAAAVDLGAGRSAVKVVIIALLLVVGGAVTTAAVGRVAARRAGRVGGEPPE